MSKKIILCGVCGNFGSKTAGDESYRFFDSMGVPRKTEGERTADDLNVEVRK